MLGRDTPVRHGRIPHTTPASAYPRRNPEQILHDSTTLARRAVARSGSGTARVSVSFAPTSPCPQISPPPSLSPPAEVLSSPSSTSSPPIEPVPLVSRLPNPPTRKTFVIHAVRPSVSPTAPADHHGSVWITSHFWSSAFGIGTKRETADPAAPFWPIGPPVYTTPSFPGARARACAIWFKGGGGGVPVLGWSYPLGRTVPMEFWPEFLATSGGHEFVAGGVGGMAGVLAGHPLDTLRIRLQQPPPPVSPGITAARVGRPPSAVALLRGILRAEGPSALYRGMGAPLASVAFQNAMVFQVYAILSRSLDPRTSTSEPPSYTSVALAGVGTGALQTLILSPVELVKIRLQLEAAGQKHRGPVDMARDIIRREGVRGVYRGLSVTALRDAPSHGVYFWTYEYARERLHPGCRRTGQESLATMLVSGGLAGVASWVCCYPLDVVKSRLQAQTHANPRYRGVVDCFRKSVREEGFPVLWRGLGTAVARAFVVNGAIFSAYELALRFLVRNDGQEMQIVMEEN